VPYFTAVVARERRRWVAQALDLDSIADLDELAGELRAVVDDEDEPVLLMVEREDAWWAVVRVDGEDDPRVFVSDSSGAAVSAYSAVLELAAADDDDEDDVVRQGACAGDFDVLADLGTSPEQLREMCDEEVPPMDALAAVAERAGFAEVLDSLR
jgi:putative tRNA adenosine deaminase-associated protein